MTSIAETACVMGVSIPLLHDEHEGGMRVKRVLLIRGYLNWLFQLLIYFGSVGVGSFLWIYPCLDVQFGCVCIVGRNCKNNVCNKCER